MLPSAIVGATVCDQFVITMGTGNMFLQCLCLRLLSISECSQLDIKLAHDALEELAVFNSCEYN